MKSYITAVLLCVALNSALGYHQLEKCPDKQHGEWSNWLRWGPCSQTCGTGAIQTRHRYCDDPEPKYGGEPCEGLSTQERNCNLPECPVKGILEDYKVIKECADPCKGYRTKERKCVQPASFSGKPACYTCPKDYDKKIEEKCYKKPECDRPDVTNVCESCKNNANKYAAEKYDPNFVGFACKTSKERCNRLKGGIKDMYAANDWFFLHCGPDFAWCKPCATRTLVYNPKCGQCEATRKGPCTGPQKWRNEHHDALDDDELW